MQALANRAEFGTQKELAFGDTGAAYVGVGTALTNPIRIAFIQNLTDATMQFSLDGVADNFPLPANGLMTIDFTANKTKNDGFFLSVGDRLYVKRIGTPTSGSVYFSFVYGVTE